MASSVLFSLFIILSMKYISAGPQRNVIWKIGNMISLQLISTPQKLYAFPNIFNCLVMGSVGAICSPLRTVLVRVLEKNGLLFDDYWACLMRSSLFDKVCHLCRKLLVVLHYLPPTYELHSFLHCVLLRSLHESSQYELPILYSC